ncbi:CLUMA_CG004444, isoform A [Clunio marinus]|uniref:CLUMA_CG004444, isoform A n=1 Tax=Clunio marinus TaxID=568069 RepID=A0A1J1HRP6_9DIPT|nr:CLUMA_CG004444, isoform A [Clunio marinus]
MWKILLPFLTLMTAQCLSSNEVRWDHSVDLDENFRLLWRVKEPDIIIEVQARTHGYVGFGFTRSEYIYGADMVIGWVDKHTFFQDRHIPVHSHNGEPVLDQSQDYVLLFGHENKTHTIIRFRRKLDTCDEKYDVPITNDTMRIVYMYHHDEPKRGSLLQGNLPEPEQALKPIKSLLFLQRPKFEKVRKLNDENIETFDVRMKNVLMTSSNVTKACSVLRLKENQRGHVVAYKPIFEPMIARTYIMHMIVYECRNKHHPNYNIDEDNASCANIQKLQCTTITATWSRGSQGFVYPDDVGYPIDSDIASLYFLEIHYEVPTKSFADHNRISDSSGIKFFMTSVKRKHNAGLLSIGIQPVWTHIIPPGFRKVTSIGYCTGKCNKEAFSTTAAGGGSGINVIGIQMQTHEMGKSIKVGLVRSGSELHPIAQDHNLDSEYLEYRALSKAIQVLPGDDLMVECAYNSFDKTKLTLGGYEAQQEICQATLVYYPKQDHLTSCYSKPKTKNFLKSLNIDKLRNSPPFAIELPEKYAGKTLEEHLKTYDWKTEFDHFERVSKTSQIDVVCSGLKRKIIEDEPVAIKQPYKPRASHCDRYNKVFQSEEQIHDNSLSNVQQARSKVLRSSELSTINFINASNRIEVCNKLNLIFLISLGYFLKIIIRV